MDKVSAARRLAALDLAGHSDPPQKSRIKQANFRDDTALDALETARELDRRRKLKTLLALPAAATKGERFEVWKGFGHWIELPPWTDESGNLWYRGKHWVEDNYDDVFRRPDRPLSRNPVNSDADDKEFQKQVQEFCRSFCED